MQTSIDQPAAFGAGPFPIARAESTPARNASTSSPTSPATVSANDFLKLLVTEMRNQDPTANTDPNEYISQLVQVNSLEQLVEINQNLGGSSSGTSGASGSASRPSAIAANAPGRTSVAGSGGNLPLPASSAAAERVAQALGVPSPSAASANLQNFVSAPGRESAGTTISSAR